MNSVQDASAQFHGPSSSSLDNSENRIRFTAITLFRIAAVLGAVALGSTALLLTSGGLFADDPTPPPPPNLPPTIVDFSGEEGVTVWMFEGQVLDENPIGMVVTFGGLLDGHQTTVSDADGYFYYGVQLQDTGTVTAVTVDDQQQTSNTATYNVQ